MAAAASRFEHPHLAAERMGEYTNADNHALA